MYISKALSSLTLIALAGTVASAQSDFQRTGLGGNTVWNNQNNWSNLTLGDIVSGFPSLADDAYF